MTTKDVREIVAAKIYGNTITNDFSKIISAAKEGRLDECIDRVRANFMAGCDLSVNWTRLAGGTTLFYLVDGVPQFNKPGEQHDNP